MSLCELCKGTGRKMFPGGLQNDCKDCSGTGVIDRYDSSDDQILDIVPVLEKVQSIKKRGRPFRNAKV